VRIAGLLGPRALIVTGACAAALALAGCGTSGAPSNAAVTVSGSTLVIYASQPPADGSDPAAADVLDAERLAFKQSGGKAGSFSLQLKVIDAKEVSDAAREVVSDNTAIAYLGEIPPGTSGVSVQITNELGILQVSPTDTSVYLTRPTPAVKGSPLHWYPSDSTFEETFGRVVPTTAAEATATVARMKRQGVKTLTVADDGTDYGASVAQEVRSDATAAGLTVSSSASGADAMFYSGLPGKAATGMLDSVANGSPKLKLYAPSALYDDAFVSGLSAAAQRALTVSSPGFMPGKLDPVGKRFVQSFTSAEGHAPAPQAIFGYEAMRAVIATLAAAGSHAADRSTVVGDFRQLKRSAADSALGAYTLKGGDTDIAPFVFAEVSGGKLVPRAQG
jgi:ABC-type branched-subunit amino acid transport system substrate-binding protein